MQYFCVVFVHHNSSGNLDQRLNKIGPTKSDAQFGPAKKATEFVLENWFSRAHEIDVERNVVMKNIVLFCRSSIVEIKHWHALTIHSTVFSDEKELYNSQLKISYNLQPENTKTTKAKRRNVRFDSCKKLLVWVEHFSPSLHVVFRTPLSRRNEDEEFSIHGIARYRHAKQSLLYNTKKSTSFRLKNSQYGASHGLNFHENFHQFHFLKLASESLVLTWFNGFR